MHFGSARNEAKCELVIVKSLPTILFHADARSSPDHASALSMTYADTVFEDPSDADPVKIRLHHYSLRRQRIGRRFDAAARTWQAGSEPQRHADRAGLSDRTGLLPASSGG